jgi:hypothetical protein
VLADGCSRFGDTSGTCLAVVKTEPFPCGLTRRSTHDAADNLLDIAALEVDCVEVSGDTWQYCVNLLLEQNVAATAMRGWAARSPTATSASCAAMSPSKGSRCLGASPRGSRGSPASEPDGVA